MSEYQITDAGSGAIYAMFWRLMEMSVHRYGSFPTGQLLIVLTIMLLDHADYHATVGELAEITRLPKSTVSRYVSAEMNGGYLEERIDPEDRRRRRLHPTARAREEQKLHQREVRKIAQSCVSVYRGKIGAEDQGNAIKKILIGFQSEVDSRRSGTGR